MTSGIERPESLGAALERLAQPGARPIAGGVAIMLDRALGHDDPARLVAIGHLRELQGVHVDAATDALVVGAATPLAVLASSQVVERRAPLLATAARAAASAGIRSIATVGGNLVDAPAASDLAAAVIALDASLVVAATTGDRVVPATGLSSSSGFLAPGELVLALRVPAGERPGWSLQRLQTQGRGDRPAVTVALRLDGPDGRASQVRAVATFLASRPIDLSEVGETVVGTPIAAFAQAARAEAIEGAASAAVDRAVAAGATLVDDTRASARYRREVVGVLVVRAIEEAAARMRQ